MTSGERWIEHVRSYPPLAVGKQIPVRIYIDEVVVSGGEIPCTILTSGYRADDHEVCRSALFYCFEGVAVAHMEGSNMNSGVD